MKKPKMQVRRKTPARAKLVLSPAEKIDKFYKLKVARAVLAVQDKLLKGEQDLIKADVISELKAQKATGLKGRVAQATINPTDVVSVKDFEKLCAWVRRGRGMARFSLFQRRYNNDYARSYWEDGKVIAGAEPFEVDNLSITKL